MMSINRYEQQKIIQVVWMCVIIAAGAVRVHAESALLNHPVLTKYPSPEDLQLRVAQFRREHPDEVAGARADFDLAIRSCLELTPATFADERQPVSIKKWRLHLPVFRAIIKQNIADFQAENRARLRAAFYQAHLDEITVEPTVALRYVLLDIILNGWDEWEAWTTERLEEYRRRHPDAYRISAVGLIGLMNHRIRTGVLRLDATVEKDESLRASGIFLRMLLDAETSPKLAGKVRTRVARIRNDVDALDFVVKLALQGENETARRNGRYCMGSLTGSLPVDQQRDFWVQYLDCDDDQIRSAAVEKVGGTIGLLKKDPKERSRNDELAARLRNIASTDPDPRIRKVAQRRIGAYEDDSPPPGLIDYGQAKKGGTSVSEPK